MQSLILQSHYYYLWRRFLVLLKASIALLIVSSFTIGLAAGSAEAGARRVALVIGNENYLNVGTLGNPHRDAEAIRAVLLNHLSFKKDDIIVLLDKDISLTRSGINDFKQRTIGAEVALIYYSGHGIFKNDNNYLIPIDAPFDPGDNQVLSISEIQQAMSAAKIGILLWDACRSTVKTSYSRGQEFVTRNLNPDGPSLGNKESNSEATILAFSAGVQQTADDGPKGQLSPFADAIVHRIAEPGRSFVITMGLVSQDVIFATTKRGRVQVPELRLSRMSPAGVSFTFIPAAARGQLPKPLVSPGPQTPPVSRSGPQTPP